MKILCISLSLLFFLSCVNEPELSNSEIENSIQEVTLRYEFTTGPLGVDSLDSFFYLAFVEIDSNNQVTSYTDPPHNFMWRFLDNTPHTKVFSECVMNPGGVHDKTTMERGTIYYVSKVSFLSETEVEVKAGYYDGGATAKLEKITLTKLNHEWNITQVTLIWVA